MGVQVRIVLYGVSPARARDAAAAAFDRIQELERILSDYDPESELRRLEHAPVGTWVELSHELAHALRMSWVVWTSTEGAFDPTVGPVTRLWRASRTTGSLPDPDALERARSRVGLDGVEFHREMLPRIRLLRPGLAFDLGGIGKGIAADSALHVLRSRRFPRALVDIGGDLALGAPPPGREGWRIGIGVPGQPPEEVWTLADAGVATSGDAEQHWVIDGARHSHIVVPSSGAPLRGSAQVTVAVDRSATFADAWSTALSVDPSLADDARTELGFRVRIAVPRDD